MHGRRSFLDEQHECTQHSNQAHDFYHAYDFECPLRQACFQDAHDARRQAVHRRPCLQAAEADQCKLSNKHRLQGRRSNKEQGKQNFQTKLTKDSRNHAQDRWSSIRNASKANEEDELCHRAQVLPQDRQQEAPWNHSQHLLQRNLYRYHFQGRRRTQARKYFQYRPQEVRNAILQEEAKEGNDPRQPLLSQYKGENSTPFRSKQERTP